MELSVSDKFTMCLKQGHTEPCNISGSLYSIHRLILAQSLYAYLSTADHRKRKRTEEQVQRAGKRQRTEGSINLSGVCPSRDITLSNGVMSHDGLDVVNFFLARYPLP